MESYVRNKRLGAVYYFVHLIFEMKLVLMSFCGANHFKYNNQACS